MNDDTLLLRLDIRGSQSDPDQFDVSVRINPQAPTEYIHDFIYILGRVHAHLIEGAQRMAATRN
jgi:hypothetical protein